MRPATSSAAFVNHVLDVAEQYGCDGDWLLQQTGLSREQLSDSIVRIPMRQLRALLELARSAATCRISACWSAPPYARAPTACWVMC